MKYKLMLQNHVDGLNQTVWHVFPPAVVGREPESQVCVDHDSVSRKHCQFALNGEGALTVKDLESMNGTYVDDSRVHQAVLMPGQIVQIGALRLQVDISTDDEVAEMARTRKKPAGSVYSTQPMETFKPVPLPPEKPWWKKILG